MSKLLKINLGLFRTFKQIYGNLKVPVNYTVPKDSAWPEEYHGMNLGRHVHKIRTEYKKNGSGHYSVDEKRALNNLGFRWITTEEDLRKRTPTVTKKTDFKRKSIELMLSVQSPNLRRKYLKMLKVLCLHGKQQNKEIMRTRLGRIPPKLKAVAQMTIVDAPLADGTLNDDTEVRTWFIRDDEGNIDRASVEASLQYIKQIWTESGPFDGILGFSMGGTVAAIISLKDNVESFPGLRFGIFIGSPDIPVAKLNYDNAEVSEDIKSLHIAGVADAVVSVESSRALVRRFRDPVVVEHEQGHCIPMKAEMLGKIVSFVSAQKAE